MTFLSNENRLYLRKQNTFEEMNEEIDVKCDPKATTDEDDASDNELKIDETVLTSTSPKNDIDIDSLDAETKTAIESIQNAIEEKAAKINLTTINVKSIIRHVVSHEHVVELIRQSDDTQEPQTPTFEPKLTRAKARELYPDNPTPLPLLTPVPSPSEVHQLITEDLAEDSSGDEYVPGEEVGEDDRDQTLTESEPGTPQSQPLIEPTEAVNFTEDGVFKVPPVRTPNSKEKEVEEDTNIALRTRSKLCLSSTPLEAIEVAFIPPDITTDMYDMDCDDEDWTDFLKKFVLPLDEVVKLTDEEEHDPEYNILEDLSIDFSDTEELREDRAVKIPKKELKALMSELAEYVDVYSASHPEASTSQVVEQQCSSLIEDALNSSQKKRCADSSTTPIIQSNPPLADPNGSSVMLGDQAILLEQQLRQHVQILTQNFLLTFRNPEYDYMSVEFKQMLSYFYHLNQNAETSKYNTCNLQGAMDLVNNWERKFNENDQEAQYTQKYMETVMRETVEHRLTKKDYVPTFPPLLLKTIANSNVFLYPGLLPVIPYKSSDALSKKNRFCKGEDELIAIGLEEFTDYLKPKTNGEVDVKLLSKYITEYMMPTRGLEQVARHINKTRKGKIIPNNPIQHFYRLGKAPTTFHYVAALEFFGIKTPKERAKELLPYQWQTYLYPSLPDVITDRLKTINSLISTKSERKSTFNNSSSTNKANRSKIIRPEFCLTPIRRIRSKRPKQLEKSFSTPSSRRSSIFCSTPKTINSPRKLQDYFQVSSKSYSYQKEFGENCLARLKFNSSIFANIKDDMFPNMPSLMNQCGGEIAGTSQSTENSPSSHITIEDDSDCREIPIKENEVNSIAPLGTKAACSKKSGNERKRARYRKDYATLSMLSPEDPKVTQEKAQSYAQAYFDKAKERLNQSEYTQFMEILNDFQEKSNSVNELYRKMQLVLDGKHSDLLEEFVTFFTPIQAQEVGKMTLYFVLNNMSLFLRNLEIYFKEQPAQLRKIFRCLSELATYTNITMEKVKNTILPLLKGNKLLTDWFLQIFPNEPPTQSLLNGQWETIELPKEMKEVNEVETVLIPESQDQFGGHNCVCTCHQSDDPLLKQRLKHCIPCGTKFLQGRVYVQTGKAVRPANVRFNDDQRERLGCPSNNKKKKFRKPSKPLSSPTKDDDHRIGVDSEDEECLKRKSTITKPTRKKKVKISDSEEKPTVSSKVCDIVNPKNDIEVCEIVQIEETIENLPKETEAKDVDGTEWDCNTSMESLELKYTPEHSAESESECGEVSSPDSDDSTEDVESLSNSPVHSDSNSNDEIVWTKDEDKTILEVFQTLGDSEETFVQISKQLQNKSLNHVKQRFKVLMSLLQQMVASTQSDKQ